MLTRAGDGWALAPTSLSFAGGSATVSGRSGSRPRFMRSSAACRSRCSTCSGPSLDLSGSATGRVDYAWKGNRNGRLDLKVRGLSRAGLVLASKPIDVGIAAMVNGNQAALRAVAASDGAIVGRAQARFAPLGGGPLVAELMNAPLFAQLRYAGPADTLVAPDRKRGHRHVGAARGRRGHRRPACRPGHPRIAEDAERPPRKPGYRHGDRPSCVSQARFSGPQLIFSQIAGQTTGGGTVAGSGSVTFSGGKTAAQPVLQRQPGAAPEPRRRRRAGDRSAADQVGRATAARSPAISNSTRAASSSAAPAPRPRCRNSTCARPASMRRT